MNEAHPASRSSRLAPLVLRLGIAAILGYGGLQHFGLFERFAPASPATPTEASTPLSETPLADAVDIDLLPAVAQGLTEGVNVPVTPGHIIATGELVAAAVLTLGWFTRFFALGILAFVGAASYAGLAGPGDIAMLQFAADIFQQQGHALALLAAGCLSLLISGCGCLGVDGRRAARKALLRDAKS